MKLQLDCDSCGLRRDGVEPPTAYARAREHEVDHPDHNVFIRR